MIYQTQETLSKWFQKLFSCTVIRKINTNTIDGELDFLVRITSLSY